MLATGIIHHANFLEIVRHPWFMSAFLAAISAQFLKMVVVWWQTGKLDFRRALRSSGGMPSTHSALVSALSLAICMTDGFDAPYSMVAVGLSAIVLIDAATLRRAAGEHAKLLNRIVAHLNTINEEDRLEAQRLEERLGHSRREVIAGVLWGCFVAWAVCACWDFWK